MTTYVVTKEEQEHFETRICYAGPDETIAQQTCDEIYKSALSAERVESFIEVWENGERQYVTRQL